MNDPVAHMRARLLLLPGMDGTDVLFAPLVSALPDWIRADVVTYPASGPNRYEDLLPIVERAILHAGECSLLGWSFSGPLALRAAQRYPDLVRSVMLAASFVRPPRPALVPLRLLIRAPTFSAVRVLRRLPVWLGRSRSDPYRQAKAKLWRTVPAKTLAKRAREIMRVDVSDELKTYAGPLLYLASAHDRVVPARNRKLVQRLRADVEVVTLAGDHFALYTDAPRAAAEIGRFLEQRVLHALPGRSASG